MMITMMMMMTIMATMTVFSVELVTHVRGVTSTNCKRYSRELNLFEYKVLVRPFGHCAMLLWLQTEMEQLI